MVDASGVSRALPADPRRTPLAGSLGFAVAYAVYAVVVALALVVASVADPRPGATAVALGVVAVAATAAGLAPRWLRSAAGNDTVEALAHYALGAVVVAGFLVAYRLAVWLAAGASGEPTLLWSPVLVLASLLGLGLGVFSRPLLPAAPDDLARPGPYLEHHLTSWWRFVQLSGTAFVAFGVGIAVTQLGQEGQTPNEHLPLLTLVAAVGVVALALFAAVKLHVVGSELREVYGNG